MDITRACKIKSGSLRIMAVCLDPVKKKKKELFLCFKIEHLQRVSAQGKHTSSFLKMAVSVVLCLVTCILQQHLTKL